jgi:spore maturation protein CgeB
MNELKEAGIHVDCFGFGWPNGPIPSDQIPVIMRDSIISLNFSAGFMSVGGNDLQIKARTFEVPGAGGFLLTDTAPGLGMVYRIGEEIEVYDGLEHLKSKIRYYLEHPERRDRIAIQGHERTRDCHTYAKRLEPIFKAALQQRDLCNAKDTARGTNLPAERKLTIFERGFRSMLVAACRIVWGPERGLKAARRITFETSVRILGARTFTARGLPGRLFPFV